MLPSCRAHLLSLVAFLKPRSSLTSFPSLVFIMTLLFLPGKDSVRSRSGRLSTAKCRKCQHPRDLLLRSAPGRPHPATSRPPASRPRLPMEQEKAPWGSGGGSRRRDRSRSPSSPAAAAVGPRDPYDYIRRTRIKADDWDRYWDNIPQAAYNNNNHAGPKNSNLKADTAASPRGWGTRLPEKPSPTAALERRTDVETKEDHEQQRTQQPPPPSGVLAMEDESLEPEVKPIAANSRGNAETESSDPAKRTARKEAAAARMSAMSEFADLVAMKSHLPSAEFRLLL